MPNEHTPARRIFDRHLELLSSGSTDEWVDLFAPDGALEYPFAPTGYPSSVHGREALHTHMTRFTQNFNVRFSDVVHHDLVDPDVAIVELLGHGSAVATGAPYDQRYICVLYVEDGLITRFLDYWDPTSFTAAAGDLEQASARHEA